jgi:hypothetical protein
VKFLIEHGADVNKMTDGVSFPVYFVSFLFISSNAFVLLSRSLFYFDWEFVSF